MAANVDENMDVSWDSDWEEYGTSSSEDDDNTEHRNTQADAGEWGDDGFLRVFSFTSLPYYNIGKAETPLDYFNLFFDADFLSILAMSINSQGQRAMSQNNLSKSRSQYWRDTDVTEIRVFIALLLHMGHVKLHKVNDYWSTDPLYTFQFKQYMARDRFLLILSNFVFLDPDSNSNTDKSEFVKPIINFFNSKIKNIVYPTKNLIVSESYVPWEGRERCERVAAGSHRLGFDMYELTDANGITVKLHNQGASHLCFDDVVMTLMEDYLDAGHSLYVHKMFTSVALAEKLLNKRTYVTGKLRAKKFENVLKNAVVIDGESATTYNPRGVCISKSLHKKKDVMITTEHHSKIGERNKHGQMTLTPNVLLEFKKNNRSAQRNHQLLAYYVSIKRSTTWYKKIIIYVMELMALNAFMMFNEQAKAKDSIQKTKSFLDFRLDIIKNVLRHTAETGKPSVEQSPKLPPDGLYVLNTGERIHGLAMLPRNDKGKCKRKNCKHCLSRNVRKATKFYCDLCQGQPGLCIDCFPVFHKYK